MAAFARAGRNTHWLSLVVLLFASRVAIAVPYVFEPGGAASAAEVNSNFAAIEAELQRIRGVSPPVVVNCEANSQALAEAIATGATAISITAGNCQLTAFERRGVVEITGVVGSDGAPLTTITPEPGFQVQTGQLISLASTGVAGSIVNRSGTLLIRLASFACSDSSQAVVDTIGGYTHISDSGFASCGGLNVVDAGRLIVERSSIQGSPSSGLLTGRTGGFVRSLQNEFIYDGESPWTFNFMDSTVVSERDIFSGSKRGIYLSGSQAVLDDGQLSGSTAADRATILVHFASELQISGGLVRNTYIDVWANGGLRLDLPPGTVFDTVGISSSDSWVALSGDFDGAAGSLDARFGSYILLANWANQPSDFAGNFAVDVGFSTLLNISEGVVGYTLNCRDGLEPRRLFDGIACLVPNSGVGSPAP